MKEDFARPTRSRRNVDRQVRVPSYAYACSVHRRLPSRWSTGSHAQLSASRFMTVYGVDVISSILDNNLARLQQLTEKHLLTANFSQLCSKGFHGHGKLTRSPSACPLLAAARLQDATIVKYLLSCGADPTHIHQGFVGSRNLESTSPLHVATTYGSLDVVEALLEAGADPNWVDMTGRTALSIATAASNCDLVSVLLSWDANQSIIDRQTGNTPLHTAVAMGHLQLVRTLLSDRSADLSRPSKKTGALPVHIAARAGHVHLIQMFCAIDPGCADARSSCYEGPTKQSPLHLAAERAYVETVLALLDLFRADANVRDSAGNTPLHRLLMKQHRPRVMRPIEFFSLTAESLVRYGADVSCRNKAGDSPISLAVQNGFLGIAEMLLRVRGGTSSQESTPTNFGRSSLPDWPSVPKHAHVSPSTNTRKGSPTPVGTKSTDGLPNGEEVKPVVSSNMKEQPSELTSKSLIAPPRSDGNITVSESENGRHEVQLIGAIDEKKLNSSNDRLHHDEFDSTVGPPLSVPEDMVDFSSKNPTARSKSPPDFHSENGCGGKPNFTVACEVPKAYTRAEKEVARTAFFQATPVAIERSDNASQDLKTGLLPSSGVTGLGDATLEKSVSSKEKQSEQFVSVLMSNETRPDECSCDQVANSVSSSDNAAVIPNPGSDAQPLNFKTSSNKVSQPTVLSAPPCKSFVEIETDVDTIDSALQDDDFSMGFVLNDDQIEFIDEDWNEVDNTESSPANGQSIDVVMSHGVQTECVVVKDTMMKDLSVDKMVPVNDSGVNGSVSIVSCTRLNRVQQATFETLTSDEESDSDAEDNGEPKSSKPLVSHITENEVESVVVDSDAAVDIPSESADGDLEEVSSKDVPQSKANHVSVSEENIGKEQQDRDFVTEQQSEEILEFARPNYESCWKPSGTSEDEILEKSLPADHHTLLTEEDNSEMGSGDFESRKHSARNSHRRRKKDDRSQLSNQTTEVTDIEILAEQPKQDIVTEQLSEQILEFTHPNYEGCWKVSGTSDDEILEKSLAADHCSPLIEEDNNEMGDGDFKNRKHSVRNSHRRRKKDDHNQLCNQMTEVTSTELSTEQPEQQIILNSLDAVAPVEQQIVTELAIETKPRKKKGSVRSRSSSRSRKVPPSDDLGVSPGQILNEQTNTEIDNKEMVNCETAEVHEAACNETLPTGTAETTLMMNSQTELEEQGDRVKLKKKKGSCRSRSGSYSKKVQPESGLTVTEIDSRVFDDDSVTGNTELPVTSDQIETNFQESQETKEGTSARHKVKRTKLKSKSNSLATEQHEPDLSSDMLETKDILSNEPSIEVVDGNGESEIRKKRKKKKKQGDEIVNTSVDLLENEQPQELLDTSDCQILEDSEPVARPKKKRLGSKRLGKLKHAADGSQLQNVDTADQNEVKMYTEETDIDIETFQFVDITPQQNVHNYSVTPAETNIDSDDSGNVHSEPIVLDSMETNIDDETDAAVTTLCSVENNRHVETDVHGNVATVPSSSVKPHASHHQKTDVGEVYSIHIDASEIQPEETLGLDEPTFAHSHPGTTPPHGHRIIIESLVRQTDIDSFANQVRANQNVSPKADRDEDSDAMEYQTEQVKETDIDADIVCNPKGSVETLVKETDIDEDTEEDLLNKRIGSADTLSSAVEPPPVQEQPRTKKQTKVRKPRQAMVNRSLSYMETSFDDFEPVMTSEAIPLAAAETKPRKSKSRLHNRSLDRADPTRPPTGVHRSRAGRIPGKMNQSCVETNLESALLADSPTSSSIVPPALTSSDVEDDAVKPDFKATLHLNADADDSEYLSEPFSRQNLGRISKPRTRNLFRQATAPERVETTDTQPSAVDNKNEHPADNKNATDGRTTSGLPPRPSSRRLHSKSFDEIPSLRIQKAAARAEAARAEDESPLSVDGANVGTSYRSPMAFDSPTGELDRPKVTNDDTEPVRSSRPIERILSDTLPSRSHSVEGDSNSRRNSLGPAMPMSRRRRRHREARGAALAAAEAEEAKLFVPLAVKEPQRSLQDAAFEMLTATMLSSAHSTDRQSFGRRNSSLSRPNSSIDTDSSSMNVVYTRGVYRPPEPPMAINRSYADCPNNSFASTDPDGTWSSFHHSTRRPRTTSASSSSYSTVL